MSKFRHRVAGGLDVMDAAPTFGAELRRWRAHRGLSQLKLALDAGVSTRHMSWLETSKSVPSRAMVLRLAEQLDLPLRERNALLAAAGYAPMFHARVFTDAALAPARAALQQLLDALEPAPAMVVDRHWTLVAANRMLPPLLQHAAPALLQPPVNVLRLSLHPQGLAPLIDNLPAWRQHVLARLQRQVAASGDSALALLHAELSALPAPVVEEDAVDDHAVLVPLRLRTSLGQMNFFTTVTVFGAPHDVTLSELAIETLLPADPGTAELLQKLHTTLRQVV